MRDEHGTVAALVAIFLFVLMGLAALAIDLGVARLAQTEMQSVADSAALEGLRWRDALAPAEDTACASPDPALDRDCARRASARDLAAILFDEGFEPARPVNAGAGPVFALGDGQGAANALQRLVFDASSVYRPRLELNEASNAPQGDMVAGAYDPTRAHREQADYRRDDFTPAAAPAAPGSEAFLVRLRRTRDADGLDNVAGVSSGGPALPFLFGRGSAIPGGDATAGYSPRHHGMTVRAAAIARARPAAIVGRGDATLGVPGTAGFALRLDFWQSFSRDAPAAPAGAPAGSIATLVAGSWQVGDAIGGGACPATSSSLPAGPLSAVVPIFQCIGGTARVIAFGSVDVDGAGELVRRASRVVPNAAASAVRAPRGSAPSAADWAEILAARGAFTDDPALAPALAR